MKAKVQWLESKASQTVASKKKSQITENGAKNCRNYLISEIAKKELKCCQQNNPTYSM